MIAIKSAVLASALAAGRNTYVQREIFYAEHGLDFDNKEN